MSASTLDEALDLVAKLNQVLQGVSAPAPTQFAEIVPADALLSLLDENVLIRTVTVYHVGRLIAVDAHTLVLADASWVADMGRFGASLSSGTLNEVERFADDVFVARGAVVDVTRWAHPLPTATK